MVQGMAITKENNFIFTRSYTNLVNSKLTIYKDMTIEKMKKCVEALEKK